MPDSSQRAATRRRGRGRPFQPGQSGNPGGRRKDEVSALARTHTKDAITRLVFWMASDNAKASVSACTAILDRGWGRPVQAVSGPDGEPLKVPGVVQFVITQIPGADNRD